MFRFLCKASLFSNSKQDANKVVYPRKARVHPDDQEKYAHLRQQEQTFGRIGEIGKETIGSAQGSDKKDVYIGGGLSSHFSKHAGREADKLVRPLSPVRASNKKHQGHKVVYMLVSNVYLLIVIASFGFMRIGMQIGREASVVIES